jgi:hypothetical protein
MRAMPREGPLPPAEERYNGIASVGRLFVSKENVMSGAAAASAAAHIAEVANAIKACGTVVRLEPKEFLRILALQENPLIVRTVGGFFSVSYRYLTSYRGLAFYCKSPTELRLPAEAELINAGTMSIPDL